MQLTKIVRIILVAALLCPGSQAIAADFQARISSILFYDGGDLIYVYFEGGTKDRPACAGSNGDYISFSMKRPRAKEYLAGLMFAYGAGKPISVRTEGACIDQSVSDTLSYFAVVNG